MGIKEEREYWDSIASLPNPYESLPDSDVPLDGILNAIVPEIDQASKGWILEIGCGVGRVTIPLAARFPNAAVYGLDFSGKMLKVAEKVYEQSKSLSNLMFIKGDGEKLPEGKFDAIYSVGLFEYLTNEAKEAYIKEAGRVLNQGGLLRLQFVESTNTGPVEYGIGRDQLTTMLEYSGFAIDKIDTELLKPNWTWVTAVCQ